MNTISHLYDTAEERQVAMHEWLCRMLGEDSPKPVLLSADASFRRYFRLQDHGRSVVIMDAPPAYESVTNFVKIAELLISLGLSVPKILARESVAGFLLLEDLGDRTYTRALSEGACEERLYQLALATLLTLQQRTLAMQPDTYQIPDYTDDLLLQEALLLLDWYYPHVYGKDCLPEVRNDFITAWQEVFVYAHAVPDALVLRDFHVDNLMVLPGREGHAACGLLDFQDAVAGPITYDLVSLLHDARRDVSIALETLLLDEFCQAYAEIDKAQLLASYWVLGAQRTTKIIGIFTRLWLRDQKPAYLRHLPRLWRLLDRELEHPALAPVKNWYEQHLPPKMRLSLPGVTTP